ncbi:type II toxin-antitoxin system VapB family antitoxin [Phenylobacterium sp. LjRoot219]|uniref:type II toxin-antitoxin system VapB family antitoxin n=1 Tax=Phenylobacterium sp. LjRoot219 TaxID=3342283 RepID=UPI003ECF59B2
MPEIRGGRARLRHQRGRDFSGTAGSRIHRRDIREPPNDPSVFQSTRSQAVRLPKEVAFPEGVRAVEIIREGKRRVIVPADAVWDDFFDAPGIELPDREQPRAQNRDEF